MSDERKITSTASFSAVRPCLVTITTKSDSRYSLPDMDKIEVFKILGPQLYGTSNLVLVNLSGACLTVPIRIIDSISIDGEIAWKATSSSTP